MLYVCTFSPEAKVWVTDEHVRTAEVYNAKQLEKNKKDKKKGKKVPLLKEDEWWVLRKSGLLSVFRDVALQLKKQLEIIVGLRLWDIRTSSYCSIVSP